MTVKIVDFWEVQPHYFVCMYVCVYYIGSIMYVRIMYVCMYVSMYYLRMYVLCMYVCMYICIMYVCMYYYVCM